MSGRARRQISTLAVILSFLYAVSAPAASVRVTVKGRSSSVLVETRMFDDITYFSLADLAAAAGASRHWHATTRKMVVLVGTHRLTLAIDSHFATLDQSVVNLKRPVRMRDGVLWVPQAFLTGALADALDARIDWFPGDADATVDVLGPAVISVGLESRTDGTAVVIGMSTHAEFDVASTSRGRISLFIHAGSLPDSIDIASGEGTIESVTFAEGQGGVAIHIATVQAARAFIAEDFERPFRLEVLVKEGGAATTAGAAIPVPSLRPQLQTGGRAALLEEDGLLTVMIDPGHGGNDTGSTGPTGLTEKEVTLGVAHELSRALQREGYYVFMTRSSDSFVPLARRAEIANMAEADIFVSLQCGAWYSSAASGFKVHFHAHPASARKSGSRGLIREFPGSVPPELAGHLWSRVHGSHTTESRTFARNVRDALAAVIDTPNRGVTAGDATVLAGCAMPAIMVELGYITNWAEEELLGDPDYQREIARAVARGVTVFMEERDGGDQ
ncbi:N-acetylmuramoyl-L-alanine amidase [bacterium]|nr:N-acetylmuramoyl-L-alanine amidase [bacterium]